MLLMGFIVFVLLMPYFETPRQLARIAAAVEQMQTNQAAAATAMARIAGTAEQMQKNQATAAAATARAERRRSPSPAGFGGRFP